MATDIPAMIEVAETRWRVHGLPPAKLGHRPDTTAQALRLANVLKSAGLPATVFHCQRDDPQSR